MEQPAEYLLAEFIERLDRKSYFGLFRMMILVVAFEIYVIWLMMCLGNYDIVRLSLIPLIVVLLVFPATMIFIKDIYRLKDRSSILFVLSTLFGFFPQYVVKGEDFSPTKTGTEELIKIIGGPALIYVDPAFVLLVRRSNGKFEAEGPGIVVLSKLEKVILIADRRIQGFREQKITTFTKDGIEVTLSDVDFRYRIWPGSGKPYRANKHSRGDDEIYPYDPMALKKRGIDLNVNKDGKTDWHANVQFVIKNQMTDYIERNRLDDLMEPTEPGVDPREIIYRQLDAAGFRQRLLDNGAMLEFRDIGHVKLPAEVVEKRQEAWQVKRNAIAELTRAHGDAKKVIHAEIDRSMAYEARFDGIKRILEEMDLPDSDHKQNITNLFMALSTQIFDELGAKHNIENGHKEAGNEN